MHKRWPNRLARLSHQSLSKFANVQFRTQFTRLSAMQNLAKQNTHKRRQTLKTKSRKDSAKACKFKRFCELLKGLVLMQVRANMCISLQKQAKLHKPLLNACKLYQSLPTFARFCLLLHAFALRNFVPSGTTHRTSTHDSRLVIQRTYYSKTIANEL